MKINLILRMNHNTATANNSKITYTYFTFYILLFILTYPSGCVSIHLSDSDGAVIWKHM